ncbi:FecCD family ABC transporter permease [Paenibacillus pasadenensis]|uniref:ABC-type Fe3+-siderophore transport system, permease component n=1 Tax=Paenibacillus pasadenensis TaxID=217090 RepID=A0A2N5N8C0_9BACL|nr:MULTISPECIES: iron ABC transporter permease [Paenibacillus]PLT46575.1 ABC-type Fe3+-siderophore transport system, permease component [Paenibacillus pasadenensis]QGG56970.1 iron chelate uptake ABC transporter family permease subunit [Paenibacillus sp. B01]
MNLSSNRSKAAGLALGALLLLGCLLLSLAYGFTAIPVKDVVRSFLHFDESSNAHIIVQTSRVPRALTAAAVGACLAVSGTLIQGLTRNPLADASILGINYGASFAIVLAVTLLSVSSLPLLTLLSFSGAAIAAAAVYALGSLGKDGLTPLKIILAGAALGALFSSFTQGMLVLDEQGLNEVIFWLTGSVAGRSFDMLKAVLPVMGCGWAGSLLLARHMNVLTMGDDAAQGLGQRTAFVKLGTGLVIVALAGSSVAVAGPIGFIGLVIPVIARFFSGNDYRWMVPYSAVLGAILVVAADVAGRFIIQPEELPVGVMTAMIGIPAFIAIARKGGIER